MVFPQIGCEPFAVVEGAERHGLHTHVLTEANVSLCQCVHDGKRLQPQIPISEVKAGLELRHGLFCPSLHSTHYRLDRFYFLSVGWDHMNQKVVRVPEQHGGQFFNMV